MIADPHAVPNPPHARAREQKAKASKADAKKRKKKKRRRSSSSSSRRSSSSS